MAPKDESELRTIQKACSATCEVFAKYLKAQIMDVIDADKVGVSCTFENYVYGRNDEKSLVKW